MKSRITRKVTKISSVKSGIRALALIAIILGNCGFSYGAPLTSLSQVCDRALILGSRALGAIPGLQSMGGYINARRFALRSREVVERSLPDLSINDPLEVPALVDGKIVTPALINSQNPRIKSRVKTIEYVFRHMDEPDFRPGFYPLDLVELEMQSLDFIIDGKTGKDFSDFPLYIDALKRFRQQTYASGWLDLAKYFVLVSFVADPEMWRWADHFLGALGSEHPYRASSGRFTQDFFDRLIKIKKMIESNPWVYAYPNFKLGGGESSHVDSMEDLSDLTDLFAFPILMEETREVHGGVYYNSLQIFLHDTADAISLYNRHKKLFGPSPINFMKDRIKLNALWNQLLSKLPPEYSNPLKLIRWYAFHEDHIDLDLSLRTGREREAAIPLTNPIQATSDEMSLVIEAMLEVTVGRVLEARTRGDGGVPPEGREYFEGLEDVLTESYIRQLLVHFQIATRGIVYP